MKDQLTLLKQENELLRNLLQDQNRKLEEKIEEFSIFRIISDTIGRVIVHKDSFRNIIREIVLSLKADNGSVMLYNSREKTLAMYVAWGTKDKKPHHPFFSLGEGIAGWVAENKVSLVLEDAGNDERFVKLYGETDEIRSLACIPMVFEDKLFGLLNISNRLSGMFKANQLRTLEIIAGQLAIAFANERVWQKQNEQELELQKKNEELEETNHKLMEAQRELVENEKIKAVGELIISMKHEINNPLTSIMGFTQLLSRLKGDIKEPSARKYLEYIEKACEEIKEVMNKLEQIKHVVTKEYIPGCTMVDLEKSSEKAVKDTLKTFAKF